MKEETSESRNLQLVSGNTYFTKGDHYQEEYGEKTPLLFKQPERNKNMSIAALGLGFILVSGILIGSYLLIQQNRTPRILAEFELVNNEIWNFMRNVSQGQVIRNENVIHILIYQTGQGPCNDFVTCIDILRSMQKYYALRFNISIPYNFLIGGDGQIYEGRGWSYESGCSFIPKQSSLTIGFIGNFTDVTPTQEQLRGGKSLIDMSLTIGKIQPNYRVYGVRNRTISRMDGVRLFNAISLWNNFDTLLEQL